MISFKRGVNPHKKLSIGEYKNQELKYSQDYAFNYTDRSIIDNSTFSEAYFQSQINKAKCRQ